MEDFKDLRVCEKAYTLSLSVDKKTRGLPKDENVRVNQSAPPCCGFGRSKLAEGCGRRADPEMRRFSQIARGSANEVEYHLLLARDLQFLSADDFEELEASVLESQRMLASLVQRLSADVLARS
jgi:four helix bundle protein